MDINHNFNAGWALLQELERKKGIDGPAPRQWGGPCPESEPETRALTGLCARFRFRHVVALHSQGEEIYWRYGDRTPPQAQMMADVLGAASGYRVADPEGLASHGGFKDWFIDSTAAPASPSSWAKGSTRCRFPTSNRCTPRPGKCCCWPLFYSQMRISLQKNTNCIVNHAVFSRISSGWQRQ